MQCKITIRHPFSFQFHQHLCKLNILLFLSYVLTVLIYCLQLCPLRDEVKICERVVVVVDVPYFTGMSEIQLKTNHANWRLLLFTTAVMKQTIFDI